MGRRILYVLSSVLLLSIPWLFGGGAVLLFVGFVPLLLLQRERPRGLWVYVAVTFALWWGFTTWWVGIAAVVGAVLAVIFGSALNTGAFMLYDYILRKGTRALAYTVFVAAWISYELLYIVGQVSFPWLTLGNGFAGDIKLVQWYEYTGVLGGSLWVLVVNLLIFNAIKEWRNIRRWMAPAAAVILPAVWSLIIYYNYREPDRKIVVTIVQPNIDPYFEKFDALSQADQDLIIMRLMVQAPDNVDFIILPETAIDNVYEGDLISNNQSVAAYRDVARRIFPRATVIAGAVTTKFYDSPQEATETAYVNRNGLIYDRFNSALQIDTTSKVGIHHKAKLVVGAETTPYYKHLKNLKFLSIDLGGMAGHYGIGTERTVFTSVGGVKTGAAICYEAVYGDYFGEFVEGGAEAMFIISNDGWWGNTTGYRNLFAFSRLRAVETRRDIARSANTGKSGFIDGRGGVAKTLGWDKRGAITGRMSLNDKVTLYVRYGDVIGRVSWLVLGLSVLYFISYRFRKRHHMAE